MGSVKKENHLNVNQYIEQVEKAFERLSPTEEQETRIKFKNHYPHINFDDYQKVLLLTKIFSMKEYPDITQAEQDAIARGHAEKLILVFSDFHQVINYLSLYEKKCIEKKDHNQSMTQACSFSLPKTPWNSMLWSKIIQKHHPSTPNDFIMRLLPYAAKIEVNLKSNPQKFEPSIRLEVENELKNKFFNEFIELHQKINKVDWINQELKDQENNINLKIKKEFYSLLKYTFSLPVNKLTYRELININKDKYQEINDNVYRSYKKMIEVAYTKQDHYILYQLNKEKNIKYVRNIVATKIKNLLSPQTSLKTLKNYANEFYYPHAAENLHAAELFFEYSMPENSFNLYLSLKPLDDIKQIPPVHIDGKKISDQYEHYYLDKLDPVDPRAALLGKMTSCCQHLDGMGKPCNIHGITQANGGFYALYKKPNKIVAQCWAWRSSQGEMVFDSIESHQDFKAHAEKRAMLTDFYFYLAKQLTQYHHVPTVLIGKSGATFTSLKKEIDTLVPLKDAILKDYTHYRDSHTQIIIASQQLPFLTEYQNGHLSTCHSFHLDKNASEEWIDLCLHNAIDWQSIERYGITFALSHAEIYKRVKLSTEWQAHCHQISDPTIWNELILLLNEVNANLPDSLGKPALFYAIQAKNIEMVRTLVQHGANVNTHIKSYNDNIKNSNILEIAAHTGAWEIVAYLLENNADCTLNEGVLGNTILNSAIQAGKLDVIQLIVPHVNINLKNKNLLHLAAKVENIEIISYLIQQGIDINTKNASGYTAMHIAARLGHKNVIDYLLRNGADKSLTTLEGMTVLHLAAELGNVDTVDYLIQQGLKINEKNNNNQNALYTAAKNNHWEVVKLLANLGAEINSTNHVTPIDLAIFANRFDIVIYLGNHGADINKNRRQQCFTAMICKLMKDYDLNINIPHLTKQWCTIFNCMSSKLLKQVVKTLKNTTSSAEDTIKAMYQVAISFNESQFTNTKERIFYQDIKAFKEIIHFFDSQDKYRYHVSQR